MRRFVSKISDFFRRRRREFEKLSRGFIIIEIDGLSYDYLLEAMERGYIPYMKRLVEEGTLKLARWRCGLPSTTPAAQAGIMFGENFDIPAFRWYEKEACRSVSSKLPGSAKIIQERASKGRIGILKGGSSYINMIDGDAEFTIFTLSSMGRGFFLESLRGLAFLLLNSLNPIRMARTIVLFFWDYILNLIKQLLALFSERSHLTFNFVSPFLTALSDLLFREIQTSACIRDINRGVPAIYTTYYSYDEVAHHFGPSSAEAFNVLRRLDRQIERIDRIRKRCPLREYDLYILSDHGLTPSIPFRHLYGCTLEEYILKQIEALPSGEFEKRFDIVIKCSGSMAHIYFNIASHQMNLSEVKALFPNLLDKLVEHEGIGLVVGREGEEMVIMAKGGRLKWKDGVKLYGENPLSSLEEPDLAVEQLRRLSSFPHSGDLILFGGWCEDEKLVCFEEQISSHGGLGGQQDYPFIMYPKEMEIEFEKITNAKELYPFFIAYSFFPKPLLSQIKSHLSEIQVSSLQ